VGLLLIFLLGAGHGWQPDHAVAAAALAVRGGIPTWIAALRLALGHCTALLMLAVLAALLPKMHWPWLDRWSTVLGASALIGVGALVFRRVWTQPHAHHAARPKSSVTVGLGWILGLSGARSAVILLPLMGGSNRAVTTLLTYCIGVTSGIVLASIGIELVRRLSAGTWAVRWLDGVLGAGSVVCGCWLLFSSGRP
jgi:hypothetical protein